MPKNTRVHRCVEKLRRKYGYPGAIGICQRSTKQSYMTGRTLRKRKRTKRRRTYKRRRRKKTRKKRGGNGSSSSAAGPGTWINELSTRGSTLTPSQPSDRSSSTPSSTESDWFFQGQRRPGADLFGRGVGEDIQLLHGCEVANRSCDCILPWKTGICTYDKKKRRIYCKCQSKFQRERKKRTRHRRRR